MEGEGHWPGAGGFNGGVRDQVPSCAQRIMPRMRAQMRVRPYHSHTRSLMPCARECACARECTCVRGRASVCLVTVKVTIVIAIVILIVKVTIFIATFPLLQISVSIGKKYGYRVLPKLKMRYREKRGCENLKSVSKLASGCGAGACPTGILQHRMAHTVTVKCSVSKD